MTNEALLLLSAIIEYAFVLIAFRLGKTWLYVFIVMNLALISVAGAKLISVFGLVTNAGNVFFAAVFVATHLLIEHYEKKDGYRTIWLGFFAILFFIIMTQLTLLLAGIVDSSPLESALRTIFGAAPRIAVASIAAYIVSQQVNVRIYASLKERSGGKNLWLRDGIAHIGGQFMDSIIFFSIAFYGLIPMAVLIQSISIGFAMKVIVGFLGTPAIYISRLIRSSQ